MQLYFARIRFDGFVEDDKTHCVTSIAYTAVVASSHRLLLMKQLPVSCREYILWYKKLEKIDPSVRATYRVELINANSRALLILVR